MRPVFLFIFLVFFFHIQAQNPLSDRELAKRDKEWFLQHPNELPIWETLKERKARAVQGSNTPVKSGFSLPKPPGPVRNVAEFEPMEGVLIRFPLGITTDVVKEMSEGTKVYCIVSSNEQSTASNNFSSAGVIMDSVIFVNAETDSYWTRDYGAWWIIDGNGTFCIIDFEYNRPQRPKDNKIPGFLGTYFNVEVYDMGLQHCGGNYMTDGYGISASTDLVWNENGNFSHDEINTIAKEYLGIDTYHVVNDPNDSHIDHIDCWGKLLAPDKVLIREVPQSSSEYNALEKAVEYWEGQTSSYGTPYRIYRVMSSGQDEAYTNSIILNNKMIVPVSNTSNDDDALAVYKEAMPGYDVLGFTGTWNNTDAMHCRSKGVADRGMLHISHIPLHDTVTSVNGEGYTIEATIKAYSDKDLIADSLVVYYRLAGQPAFSLVKFEKTSDDIYKAVIPQPQKSGEMSYYIHAADKSGRSEYHPYIGEPDPHRFYAVELGSFTLFPNGIPDASLVLRCYPNPFRSQTKIMFKPGSSGSQATIGMYDNLGHKIREWKISGPKSCIFWDGTDSNGRKVSAGVYYYRIKTSTSTLTGKVQLVK